MGLSCLACPATLGDGGAAVVHARRVHLGSWGPRWACSHCPFVAAGLPSALAHCLVLGHHPAALQCVSPPHRPRPLSGAHIGRKTSEQVPLSQLFALEQGPEPADSDALDGLLDSMLCEQPRSPAQV